jgi:hypothetical protein
MAQTFKQDVPIEIGRGEVIAVVTYTYTPGTPEVLYQRNGDPGWPAEAAEVEITDMKVAGETVPEWFAKAAHDYAHGWLHENHEDPGPEPDDERDRRRDDALCGIR